MNTNYFRRQLGRRHLAYSLLPVPYGRISTTNPDRNYHVRNTDYIDINEELIGCSFLKIFFVLLRISRFLNYLQKTDVLSNKVDRIRNSSDFVDRGYSKDAIANTT